MILGTPYNVLLAFFVGGAIGSIVTTIATLIDGRIAARRDHRLFNIKE